MKCPENIGDLAACVAREVKMRENAYPKWVNMGRMDPRTADRELALMRQIAHLVYAVRDEFGPQGQLPGLQRPAAEMAIERRMDQMEPWNGGQ